MSILSAESGAATGSEASAGGAGGRSEVVLSFCWGKKSPNFLNNANHTVMLSRSGFSSDLYGRHSTSRDVYLTFREGVSSVRGKIVAFVLSTRKRDKARVLTF